MSYIRGCQGDRAHRNGRDEMMSSLHPTTIVSLRAAAIEYRRLATLPENSRTSRALIQSAEHIEAQCLVAQPNAIKPQSLARERYESAWHVKQNLRS